MTSSDGLAVSSRPRWTGSGISIVPPPMLSITCSMRTLISSWSVARCSSMRPSLSAQLDPAQVSFIVDELPRVLVSERRNERVEGPGLRAADLEHERPTGRQPPARIVQHADQDVQ